jgi:hypothetical protein
VNKVVIDTNAKGSGVVPYLPLPALQPVPPVRPAPTPPAAGSATTTSGGGQ